VNSKNQEDWEKNFSLFNEGLSRIKSYKTIDPVKLSQGKFTQNFELLQFIYDFIAKTYNEPVKKYNAYEKRLEILKSQYGKISDIKKYLPSHLIPNEYILKMEKEKYYGNKPNDETNQYSEYINLLQDDLKLIMDKNISLSNEITEIEEERQYYLSKLIKVMNFCKQHKDLDNIIDIIKHIPEDFK
jgi:hypothetical protein